MRFGRTLRRYLAGDAAGPGGRAAVAVAARARHRVAMAGRARLGVGDRGGRPRPAGLAACEAGPAARQRRSARRARRSGRAVARLERRRARGVVRGARHRRRDGAVFVHRDRAACSPAPATRSRRWRAACIPRPISAWAQFSLPEVLLLAERLCRDVRREALRHIPGIRTLRLSHLLWVQRQTSAMAEPRRPDGASATAFGGCARRAQSAAGRRPGNQRHVRGEDRERPLLSPARLRRRGCWCSRSAAPPSTSTPAGWRCRRRSCASRESAMRPRRPSRRGRAGADRSDRPGQRGQVEPGERIGTGDAERGRAGADDRARGGISARAGRPSGGVARRLCRASAGAPRRSCWRRPSAPTSSCGSPPRPSRRARPTVERPRRISRLGQGAAGTPRRRPLFWRSPMSMSCAPRNEWTPPYDVGRAGGARRRSAIRAAIDAVARALDLPADAIVPVAMPPGREPYNLDAPVGAHRGRARRGQAGAARSPADRPATTEPARACGSARPCRPLRHAGHRQVLRLRAHGARRRGADHLRGAAPWLTQPPFG